MQTKNTEILDDFPKVFGRFSKQPNDYYMPKGHVGTVKDGVGIIPAVFRKLGGVSRGLAPKPKIPIWVTKFEQNE